jgi:hypothetical protein
VFDDRGTSCASTPPTIHGLAWKCRQQKPGATDRLTAAALCGIFTASQHCSSPRSMLVASRFALFFFVGRTCELHWLVLAVMRLLATTTSASSCAVKLSALVVSCVPCGCAGKLLWLARAALPLLATVTSASSCIFKHRHAFSSPVHLLFVLSVAAQASCSGWLA